LGAGRLGATVVNIGPDDLQTKTGETLEDTARTLSLYLDILVMRTNDSVAEMKIFANWPKMAVVNALSSEEHPTQAIADLATILEHFGRLDGISVVYLGEGNKTAAALALAMSRIPRTRLTVATPRGYRLNRETLATAGSLAAKHGAVIEETQDATSLPQGADVIYTSRWQEMGLEKAEIDWKRCFTPFRVTRSLVERLSGPGTIFMHDLPAVRGEEVDSEVLDGPRSLAWTQAENKLFSAMAVMEWCAVGRCAKLLEAAPSYPKPLAAAASY
jgi:ornithine carbamoyltransferase